MWWSQGKAHEHMKGLEYSCGQPGLEDRTRLWPCCTTWKGPSDPASCLWKHPERMTEEHNDKVIVYASGLWLSRYIYVGRSRQAQCTIQRAKTKIFQKQKTSNSNSTYAQANTPCLKALHLALYSWCTSVQFRPQQEKQTIILFGVLHLSSWC